MLRFPELQLGTDSVILDLGSNRGRFSLAFANNGSRIFCFEPNPFVFAKSVQLLRNFKNIHLLQAAVTQKSECKNLFFHKDSRVDQIAFSISASIVDSKFNIDTSSSHRVLGISLSQILANFNQVDLLKIDIEGGEIFLLEILKKNFEKIRYLLMETHEGKVGEGAQSLESFRKFIVSKGLSQRWHLDWE